MCQRTGTGVEPRKLMRCARSALTTRLAWIFAAGVGGGVAQSRFGAASASWANSGLILAVAVAVAKQAHAQDMRNSRRFTTNLPNGLFWLEAHAWSHLNQATAAGRARLLHPFKAQEAF